MTFLPITLGIRHTSDAEKGASVDRSRLKANMEKALRRDDHACRFCGFQAKNFQRVIPYEEAGTDLPFVTTCTFCEQCVALERAGLMGSGYLIWLPEMSQAELNHLVRAIYVAQAVKGPMAANATRAMDALMSRRADAKKRLGVDDPLLLATIMHEQLSDEEIAEAGRKLAGVRLLPLNKHLVRGPKGNVDQFPQMIKYWRSPEGPFAKLPVDKWADMFTAAEASAGRA